MAIFIEANYAKRIGLPDYSSHQFSVKALERDHESLKKNIRALREVPV